MSMLSLSPAGHQSKKILALPQSVGYAVGWLARSQWRLA